MVTFGTCLGVIAQILVENPRILEAEAGGSQSPNYTVSVLKTNKVPLRGSYREGRTARPRREGPWETIISQCIYSWKAKAQHSNLPGVPAAPAGAPHVGSRGLCSEGRVFIRGSQGASPADCELRRSHAQESPSPDILPLNARSAY